LRVRNPEGVWWKLV